MKKYILFLSLCLITIPTTLADDSEVSWCITQLVQVQEQLNIEADVEKMCQEVASTGVAILEREGQRDVHLYWIPLGSTVNIEHEVRFNLDHFVKFIEELQLRDSA